MSLPKRYLVQNVLVTSTGENWLSLFSGGESIGPEEISPLCQNGTVLYTSKEKANALNDYFIKQVP